MPPFGLEKECCAGVEGQKNPSQTQSKRRKEKSKAKGYFCPQIDKGMDGENVGNGL